MTAIKEKEDFEEVVERNIKRTRFLGACDEHETIYLLSKEIDEYRDKIKNLEIIKKVPEVKETPNVYINIESLYFTYNPEDHKIKGLSKVIKASCDNISKMEEYKGYEK